MKIEGQCLYCTSIGVNLASPVRRMRIWLQQEIAVDVNLCLAHSSLPTETVRDAFLELAAGANRPQGSE